MSMTEITAKLSTALADRYRIERHLGAVYACFDVLHDETRAAMISYRDLSRFTD